MNSSQAEPNFQYRLNSKRYFTYEENDNHTKVNQVDQGFDFEDENIAWTVRTTDKNVEPPASRLHRFLWDKSFKETDHYVYVHDKEVQYDLMNE